MTDFIQSANDRPSAVDIKKAIITAQTAANFKVWYFNDEAVLTVYFHEHELTDDNFDKLMTTKEILKTTFDDDETFLDFVLTEFVYKEILLSTDAAMDMYQKHISNIEGMHVIAKKQLAILREQKKTKARKVRRGENRLAQESAGNLNTSLPNVTASVSATYMKECKVYIIIMTCTLYYFYFYFYGSHLYRMLF